MLEQGLDAPPVTYIEADINAYISRRVTMETKKAARHVEKQATPTTQPTSISATAEEPPMKS